ncbi:hypothetical protein IWW47_002931 [Coemansia sp. RSA 2052]|nr:hypothetical protein IWW47_002931 [Coemansia sp. RSA 2052]
MFGVPSGGAYTKALPETVVIREQTMLRRRPSSSAVAKRKRKDSELADRPERVESKLDAKRSLQTGAKSREHIAAVPATQVTGGDEAAAAPQASRRLGDTTARRRTGDLGRMANG